MCCCLCGILLQGGESGVQMTVSSGKRLSHRGTTRMGPSSQGKALSNPRGQTLSLWTLWPFSHLGCHLQTIGCFSSGGDEGLEVGFGIKCRDTVTFFSSQHVVTATLANPLSCLPVCYLFTSLCLPQLFVLPRSPICLLTPLTQLPCLLSPCDCRSPDSRW